MLAMTRTPLRVSLFGGGTDYPAYFNRSPGAVIGFTINKHIYISSLLLSGGHDYSYRVAYSKVEYTHKVDEINHPIVRTVLQYLNVCDRMDISVVADLRAGGGLGSSSAFTVGFLQLISAQLGMPLGVMELAQSAIHVERDLLGETVGVQDQLHAAHGGVSRFDFRSSGEITATPISLSFASRSALNKSLVLINTGVSRRASDSAKTTVKLIGARAADRVFERLFSMVSECETMLQSSGEVVRDLGEMLNEGWALKRTVTSSANLDIADAIYSAARTAGALGGKLCGAGGGGYLAMVVPEGRLKNVIEAVSPYAVIPIQIEPQGATLVHPPLSIASHARPQASIAQLSFGGAS